MERRMNRLWTGLAGGALLVGGWLAGTSVGQQGVEQSGTSGGQFVARGKFDVQIGGEGLGQVLPFGGQVKDVREIVIMRDWATLSMVDAGKNVTLVVPREKVSFIQVID